VISLSLRSQRPGTGTTKHGAAVILVRLDIVTENVAAGMIQVSEQFLETTAVRVEEPRQFADKVAVSDESAPDRLATSPPGPGVPGPGGRKEPDDLVLETSAPVNKRRVWDSAKSRCSPVQ
jgi:hypothetical protein